MEERSAIAKRILSYEVRIAELENCMIHDTISKSENVKLLKSQLYNYTHDVNFKRSKNMGEILRTALDFVKRNYENINESYS